MTLGEHFEIVRLSLELFQDVEDVDGLPVQFSLVIQVDFELLQVVDCRRACSEVLLLRMLLVYLGNVFFHLFDFDSFELVGQHSKTGILIHGGCSCDIFTSVHTWRFLSFQSRQFHLFFF